MNKYSSPAAKTNKTKRNRKPSPTTEKAYRLAIEASTGTLTDVSRRLKITTGSVSLYLDKHPEMKTLLTNKRMDNVQLAEDVLFEHLHKGTPPNIRQDSAKYITGRLGKKAGWVEKQEIGVSNSTDLTKEQMEEIIARLKE